MTVHARTENQPPPPPLVVSPVVFEQFLAALGFDWRHTISFRYERNRDREVLVVERLRLNGAGFPQEDRTGRYVTETFEVAVAS